MCDDEKGYIVVETVCAFIPFVLLVVSILSLVNIVTLQARVHYALTQTAKTMSVYNYMLEVTGIANDLTALADKADKAPKAANELRDGVNAVLSGIESLSSIGEALGLLHSADEAAVGDPRAVISQLLGIERFNLQGQAFNLLVRPLTMRYLKNGDMMGEEYLRSVRVVGAGAGLDFARSELLDKDGNVRLTVEYEVEYTFGALPLPFSPTLRITQTAVTKAWLNGSGRGYW
ncbi:MAG: hypothetical protein FWB97_03085 [Oscillospiraceae bacterium]|nr:hypothetical protein [Oscillospiraceae bacterium]